MKTSDRTILFKVQADAQDIVEFIQGHDHDSFVANKILKKAVVMSMSTAMQTPLEFGITVHLLLKISYFGAYTGYLTHVLLSV
jgi:hypothetical protein